MKLTLEDGSCLRPICKDNAINQGLFHEWNRLYFETHEDNRTVNKL